MGVQSHPKLIEGEVRVIGRRWSPRVHAIKAFLTRSRVTNSTVIGAEGEGHLEWLTIEDVKTGETERVRADGLFVFIGATPHTEWLEGKVARDPQGFILSGSDLKQNGKFGHNWPLERDPYMLETSRPGVFVAGDVRKGSIKRLASAVGEGAMAVQFVHYCRRQQATH